VAQLPWPFSPEEGAVGVQQEPDLHSWPAKEVGEIRAVQATDPCPPEEEVVGAREAQLASLFWPATGLAQAVQLSSLFWSALGAGVAGAVQVTDP
jgi:hypothetical protein